MKKKISKIKLENQMRKENKIQKSATRTQTQGRTKDTV